MTQPGQKHILVIKLGALGDFIQALGPMAAIRHHHEQDRITLMTTRPFEALAKASGYFDEVWVHERPRWIDFGAWIDLYQQLNDGEFDRVYDLQNSDRTGLYFKLFSPRPQWVGIAKGASHRNTSPARTAGLSFDGHVQSLALAGIRDIEIDTLNWVRGPGHYEELNSPYVLIVPGSSAQHTEKRWPAHHYIDLCQKLLSGGLQPVLIGTNDEADVTSMIAQAVPKVLNLTGKTSLFDLPPLARHAYGAIGNDTGPIHMIAPTGCNTVVIFSRYSQPHRHAPKGANVMTLQKDNLNDLQVQDVLNALRASKN